MRPQNIGVVRHIILPVAAFWPQSAETARYICLSEILWAMVRSECRCLVCTTIKRGDTPQKCSRRLGCRRASKPFWPLASLFWPLPVLSSSRKKLSSSKNRSWLNRFPRSTKRLSGRVTPAPIAPLIRCAAQCLRKIITQKFNLPLVRNALLATILRSGYGPEDISRTHWRSKCQERSKQSVRLRRLHSSSQAVHNSSRNRWLSRRNRFSTSLVKPLGVKVTQPTIRTTKNILASRLNARNMTRKAYLARHRAVNRMIRIATRIHRFLRLWLVSRKFQDFPETGNFGSVASHCGHSQRGAISC